MFGDPEHAVVSGATVPFGVVAELQGRAKSCRRRSRCASPFRVLEDQRSNIRPIQASRVEGLPAITSRLRTTLYAKAICSSAVREYGRIEFGAVAYVGEDLPGDLVPPDKISGVLSGAIREVSRCTTGTLFLTPSVRRRMSQLASGTGGSMKNISKGCWFSLSYQGGYRRTTRVRLAVHATTGLSSHLFT